MTALSDALAAAQARAVTALSKTYVHGSLTPEEVRLALDAAGLTDVVEQDHLLAALDTIKQHGATAPTEQRRTPVPSETEPATDRQWERIKRDCAAKKVSAPDGPLTKSQASDVINQLEAGSYDPAAWEVPF